MHTHHPPYTSLLTHLHTHLPNSGPLYRRIQHHLAHPSPTAYVLASFAEDSGDPNPNPDRNKNNDTDNGNNSDNEPWLAAYADLHAGPDTQLWLFSSLESTSNPCHHAQEQNTNLNSNSKCYHWTEHETSTAKSQLLDLFVFIRDTLVPPYLESLALPSKETTKTKTVQTDPIDEGVKKIPAHPPTSILAGSVHKEVVRLVLELAAESRSAAGSLSSSEKQAQAQKKRRLRILRGQDIFYAKYCFPSSSSTAKTNKVEEEYVFHDSNGIPGIQEHHIPLVKARTHIPRSTEALLAMGGVALFHPSSSSSSSAAAAAASSLDSLDSSTVATVLADKDEMPIAWGFLGFDGSLCSLHVEEEHRGRGLAVLVGREVMERGVEVFHSHNGTETETERVSGEQEGEEWFFADVALENGASRRVMEKMGGFVGWVVAWMVVEIDGL
ncbi:hypothetical protein BJX61DRAFT_9379 [Aspergillus egyptiacus]|nr:hypothetical protein BJX61DRAFT_9379 [Aspergillus egyptiacus]